MFLDIAFGIFGSYLTGEIFHEVVTWHLILFGVFFALLPDIDILWYKSNQKIDHRSFMHWPSFYFIASIFVYFILGNKIAFLFLITALFHFVHDTFILGWGVSWFAPFSYRRFKLFPDNGKGGFLKEKFLTWLPEEQKSLEQKLDDKHWIRNWYGKVTVVSLIEYSSFLIAIAYILNNLPK